MKLPGKKKTIEHDPHEFTARKTTGIWWAAFAFLGLMWIGTLAYFEIDRHSLALGLGTGAILVAWAIDVTGGKVPASWRSKPPRDR